MLRRGFKSWCENTSISYRKTLRLEKHAPLCSHILAKYLDVKLLTPNEINGLSTSDINLLLKTDSDSWSAVALSNNKSNIIIYNSSHAKTRQANDIMHELSHIIIRHKPQMTHYSEEIGILLRQYDKMQEEEADCLAATLLLPKEALIKIKFARKSVALAADYYGVSQQLMRMRLGTSGANSIYKRTKR